MWESQCHKSPIKNVILGIVVFGFTTLISIPFGYVTQRTGKSFFLFIRMCIIINQLFFGHGLHSCIEMSAINRRLIYLIESQLDIPLTIMEYI
jgi:hypothetical protein